MWGKVGIIITVLFIWVSISLTYAAWNGTQVTLGASSFSIIDAGEFFVKAFAFGAIPDLPYLFTVFWWILAVMLALAGYLLIREG